MIVRVTAVLFAGVATCAGMPTMAQAAKLPPIMASSKNTVPACVTPGRLMAFLRDRNSRLSSRHDNIATEYMRHGEDLGIRWDYAFFQMLVETGSLTFKGDVNWKQNNFAGLGATGGGVRGESFKTVGLGARAHMQHTMMYAGTFIENPVADRTRKIQEWRVLDKWRKRLPKPVTFTHLTRKWSPTDRGYSNDIKAVADRFFNGFCKIADPQPELVAVARGETEKAAVVPTVGEKLAADALERGRKDSAPRSSLGGSSLAEGLSKTYKAAKDSAPSYKILNNKDGAAAKSAKASGAAKNKTAKTTPSIPSKELPVKTAAAGTAAAVAAPTVKPGDCRVWTASYGGANAVIIKALGNDGMTNFTVLDVNKGQEDREANAYISAYAKGGKTVSRFNSQNAALDKAFKLCPEK